MLIRKLQDKMNVLEHSDLLRHKWIAQSKTGTQQMLLNSSQSNLSKQTLFCSNDYLGFASHPDILCALKEGVDRWGGGSGASHLISGHMAPHEELEVTLSQLFSRLIPDNRCLTFSTGYMANLAVMTVLGDVSSEIFSDELNHASLIDGIRLCKGKINIYKHRDYDALTELLEKSTADIRLIVTDGVFSMDGDQANVDVLQKLAYKYDAWIVLDDAHGYGVIGDEGLGSLEVEQSINGRVILIGTLGKSAGLSGAFIVAHQTIIEYIFQTARTYIYTTAPLPAISYALVKSLDLMHGGEGKQRRGHLRVLEQHLRCGLSQLVVEHSNAGLTISESVSPIQAVIVGESRRAMDLSAGLSELGFRVSGIRPPTVPIGTSRIRLTLSADHTIDDIDRLIDAFHALFNKRI
ncbi:MAG: 8-amino-7-oxononanoate synthase [Proteobacteria bacterium]|nr:8-amino-7-oxononanoate synthase [Pseudomonadota bacterium]MDA1332152.1 8-amino-7-oxononanoate synthase [Pseudomonadota bacterium]